MRILDILFLITFLIMTVYFLISLLRYRKEEVPKETKEETCDIVRLPKQLRNYGMFFMVMGVAFGVFLYIVTRNINGLYLGLIFTMCGSFMVSGYMNFKIAYGKKTFIYRNNLGIKRQYNFDDITRLAWGKTGVLDVVVYVGKNKVRIDEISVGGVEFIERAEKIVRDRHGKKEKRLGEGKRNLGVK